MIKSKPNVGGAEFEHYHAAIRAVLIQNQARQNALAAVLRALLVAAGAAIPAAERKAWLDGLYGIGRIFNDARGGAAFDDFTPEDMLAAAEVARQSTAQLTGFVDSIAEALLPAALAQS